MCAIPIALSSSLFFFLIPFHLYIPLMRQKKKQTNELKHQQRLESKTIQLNDILIIILGIILNILPKQIWLMRNIYYVLIGALSRHCALFFPIRSRSFYTRWDRVSVSTLFNTHTDTHTLDRWIFSVWFFSSHSSLPSLCLAHVLQYLYTYSDYTSIHQAFCSFGFGFGFVVVVVVWIRTIFCRRVNMWAFIAHHFSPIKMYCFIAYGSNKHK